MSAQNQHQDLRELAQQIVDRKHGYDLPDKMLAAAYLGLFEQLQSAEQHAIEQDGVVAEWRERVESAERDKADAHLAYDGLKEQLSAPCRCDKCCDCVAADGYERLQEQLEALRAEMQFINDAAMSFHKGEEGKARVLNVIGARSGNALLGSNPATGSALYDVPEPIQRADGAAGKPGADSVPAKELIGEPIGDSTVRFTDIFPASSPSADRHNRAFPTATGAYDQPKESPAFDPASSEPEGR